jgi:hypothetical protein
MSTINQLTSVDQINASDQVPIFSTNNGDARRASFTTIARFIASQITTADNFITQYFAPSATGFSVSILDTTDNIYLLLTPTAGFAAGTIVFPPVANCVDKQMILVSCTQAVTTLTLNGNGAPINGTLTTLAADGFFRFRFDGVVKAWYRIG